MSTMTDEYDVTVHSRNDTGRIRKRVKGDEMAPEITAGDLVELNPCDRVMGGGGVYMVRVDGQEMLQHAQRVPGRRLRLHGYNDDHEETVIRRREDGSWVTADGFNVSFEVVGRFVEVAEAPSSPL